jgi:hypothetical protein
MSIEEEANITRAAWETFLANNGLAYDSTKFNDGTPIYGWNIHHDVLVEPLSYPIEDRIQFILTHKDEAEQVIRLKNMRPVSLESLKVVISAEKLLDESIACAWNLYEESIACAWNLYEESIASAWKLYDKSIASAKNLLDESIASAWKLYKESTASARKLYYESTAPAHLADVPNHTWNGENIFSMEVN